MRTDKRDDQVIPCKYVWYTCSDGRFVAIIFWLFFTMALISTKRNWLSLLRKTAKIPGFQLLCLQKILFCFYAMLLFSRIGYLGNVWVNMYFIKQTSTQIRLEKSEVNKCMVVYNAFTSPNYFFFFTSLHKYFTVLVKGSNFFNVAFVRVSG